MRISPKRVLFNKLWLYTFLLNVSIVYYYYAKFPLMKFPLIMYPITATMSIVNPMWHWLVPDGLKKGLSSSFSYLHYIPNLAVGYRTKYEGKLITMEHGSFSKKKTHWVLWIAGGGFTSCNSRDYVQVSQQILEKHRGPISISILCCTPPGSFDEADLIYPRIHQTCADSLEQFSDSVVSQDRSFLTIVADDTGASLLISMLQYLNTQQRNIQYDNILFVAPISHFHHFDFPSSPKQKFVEPVQYFGYDDYVQFWLTYLLGEAEPQMHKLLRESQHISADVRNNTPPYLVYWTSRYTFLRNKKFRESFYYDPKAIRTFNRFVVDPYLNPLLLPENLLDALVDVEKITIISLMNSATRDDSLFLTDFLESSLTSKNYNPSVKIENYFLHSGFTGCLRFSTWFNSCPELIGKIAQVLKNWTLEKHL